MFIHPPINLTPQQIADKIDSLDGVNLLTDEQASAIPDVVASVNLFNINDPDVTEGRFVNVTNGQLNVNAAHNASHFIAVSPGDDLYISNAERYVWYNDAQNFVEGFDLNRGPKQLVVPDGVEFVRFSVDRPLDNVIVALSDTAVPFEPFVDPTSSNQPAVDLSPLYRIQANLGNSNTWVLPQNVLYIGDSFWNNTTDIAAEAIRISGIQGTFNGTSVPGSTLSRIGDVLNGFDLTPFDTIVIGRGANDQIQGINLETYQIRILTVLGFFVGLGKQIMLANIPPLGHYENFNGAFQASLVEKNNWLDSLFDEDNSSFRIFDLNGSLDTNGNGRIDDELAIGGTNIHPNEAGSTAAATALAARFQP